MHPFFPASRLGICAALLLSGFLALTRTQSVADPAQDQRALNLATFDQVWTTVRDRHFDEQLGGLDWDAVRETYRPLAAEAPSRQKLRPILGSMLGLLKQSHLAIVPEIPIQSDAKAGGETPPGAQVWSSSCGFAVRLEHGIPVVAGVQPRSQVGRAGVQVGWRIGSVAGKLIPTPLDYTGDVNFPLLSATGASVSIGFIDPQGEQHLVSVALAGLRQRSYSFPGLPPMVVSVEHRALESRVGYIAFNWFFDPVLVMSQFNAAVKTYMQGDGLIIDVRQNPGGMGVMTAAMISWFVPGEQRVVGTFSSRSSDLELIAPRRPAYFKGRVAVLIDGGSGSSAEVFAAGMRDVAGARLFGRNTGGAVLPSAFDQLPNGDHLQFIVANYVTVKGKELEGDGVAPDQRTPPARTEDPFEDQTILAALDWIYAAK